MTQQNHDRRKESGLVRHGSSLRLRLTFMIVAIFAVIQISIAVVSLLYVQDVSSNLYSQRVEARVRSMAERLGKLPAPFTDEVVREIAQDEARSILFEGFALSVYDDSLRLVATSHRPALDPEQSGGEEALASSRPVIRRNKVQALQTSDPGEESSRSMAMRFTGSDGRRYVMIAAASDALVTLLTQHLSRYIVISTPIGLLGVAAAAWLVAGLATRPFRRLSEIAHALGPETLHEKIEMGSNAAELASLQADLNDARRRLDAGLEAQERFVANVSHEINTPIATVLAEAELLSRDPALAPKGRQFVGSVREEMYRLGKLVESFLILTRVRHGKRGPGRTTLTGINDLVMDAVTHCLTMAKEHQVTLAPQIAGDDTSDLLIHGDPELLRTMIENLIRNGIRFSPKGGRIKIDVQIDRPNALVCVRDYGPGIAESLLPKLFDRFAQGAKEERLGRGSGLGLEIAQGIAELHGGNIEASNCTDGGCRFCITLPLELPAENEEKLMHISGEIHGR